MKLCRIFCSIFLALFMLFSSQEKKPTINLSNIPHHLVSKNQNNEEVFSYKDVFWNYYEPILIEKKQLQNSFIDFSTFCELYYEYNFSLPEYCLKWRHANTLEEFQNISMCSSKKAKYATVSSSSSDAYYVLNSTTYDETPTDVFKELPIYYDYDSLVKILMNGDIIYETVTIFFNAGHNALITKLDQKTTDGRYFIQTIEAVGSGVNYGFLDDQRIVDFGVKILRTTAPTMSYIPLVIYFAEQQLGKKYCPDYDRKAHSNIDSEDWYCSELVWAAYMYAEIDISYYIGKTEETNAVWPIHIYLSDMVGEIIIKPKNLRLAIVNKNGSTWTISIINNNPVDLTAMYNSKMCNLEDAQYWNTNNLKDIDLVNISAYSSADVEITENLFATAIACSYIDEFYRYITYADSLNATSRFIMVRYSVIYNE